MKNQRDIDAAIGSAASEPVPDPEQAMDRVLQLLRSKMKEKKITQTKIQRIWGWKGSYISQILIQSKHFRVRDFLKILHVMDIRPQTFFAEIYPPEPEMIAEQTESEKNMANLKETLSDLGAQLEQLFTDSKSTAR